MSEESIITKLEPKDGDFMFTEERGWVEYNSEHGWLSTPTIDVDVEDLLMTWEDLVNELSDKEVRLLQLKEYINEMSFRIEQETDFKELYGKNNADIRKHHIKSELSDVFDEVNSLELSINWIKGYVPLLRECIRIKGE